MPSATNRFFAGVDRDRSREMVQEGWLRKLLNFRLMRKRGGDLQAWSAGGNVHAFDLGRFRPIGSAEYDGVSYILSVDPLDGDCQIGTYPSPLETGAGGFEHVYRPLMNWSATDPRVDPDSERMPFITSLLNFDCSRQAEVELSLSYDGSIDIYFADWRNPLRKVNSGFHASTGAYNGRRYWSGGLLSSIDLSFESCPHPTLVSAQVLSGGKWPAGNTVFYLRYVNAEMDKTSFLAQTGPVQVGINLPSDGIITDGDPAETATPNMVRLSWAGIDPTFSFVEIAFAYYSDDTVEVGLIDRMYEIAPGQNTLIMDIKGTEDVIDLTPDELIRTKDPADSPRSITQFENRLWGANWRVPGVDEQKLATIAQQILAEPNDSNQLHEVDDGPFYSNTSHALSYKDYANTLGRVGYFRGETYSFAIVFVMNGGKETRAFPVQGYDAWMDPTATQRNPNGSLRMPSNMNPGYSMYNNAGKKLRYLGVAFDTSQVVVPLDVQAKVCGFYLTRCERKENLLYQGVLANCYTPDQATWDSFTNAKIGAGYSSKINTTSAMPELSFLGQGVTPTRWRTPQFGVVYSAESYNSRVANRFGLFSSDHFFLKESTDGLAWLMDLGTAAYTSSDIGSTIGRFPTFICDQSGYSPGSSLVQPGVNLGKCMTWNVKDNEYSETGPSTGMKFGSAYAEAGQDALGNGLPIWWYGWRYSMGSIYEYGTRAMKQRRYIGIALDIPGQGTPSMDPLLVETAGVAHVVNLYRLDPAAVDVANLYQPASEIYRRISPFIPISDIHAISGQPFYGGDCFLARTYHRHMSAMETNEVSGNGVYQKYGIMAGFIQESKVNTSMRGVDKNGATYYPAYYPGSPQGMATEQCGMPESDQYNDGYDEVLGMKGVAGYDLNVPNGGIGYPNRIKYSQRKVPGATYDSYRTWDLAAFEDFDPRIGPMVKISSQSGRLFTVSEAGLLAHSVNERGIVGDGQGAGLVIGEGEVLSPHVFHIGDGMGSQHQWSMIKGEAGFYGYDHRRRAIWRFNGESLEAISVSKHFSTDAHEVGDSFDGMDTDIVHVLPDAPVCVGGVSAWHNRRFHEVGWTFQLLNSNEANPRSLVFSEEANVYIGERSHHSPFYLNIALDLYSVNPGSRGAFWLHEQGGYTDYYAQGPTSLLAYVANAGATLPKAFDAAHLFATPQAPYSLAVNTEYQSYTLNPFISADKWKLPLYKEGAWRLPILRATAASPGQDLYLKSRMVGKWAEVEFAWRTTDEVGVANAETIFRISKS